MPDDFDFEGALASQVASQEETTPAEEPAPEEPAEHVLDTDDNLEVPEVVGGEEAKAETEQEEETGEEEVVDTTLALDARSSEYLKELTEHFGGDTAKALRSALDAQGMIGRQSTELGDLRKAVEALQNRDQNAPQPFPGDLDEQIEENPGAVARWALEQNQPGIYDAAISSWYDEDPRSAGRFERALEMDMLRREIQENVAPQLEPVRQQTAARSMSQAQESLRATYPDLDSILESATEDEVAGLDATVIRQLQETNPKAALETIYRWVKAGRPAESQAQATSERQEAARAAKRDAAVVSASSTPAREGKDNYERLKDFMLTPEPHSVSHGLQR